MGFGSDISVGLEGGSGSRSKAEPKTMALFRAKVHPTIQSVARVVLLPKTPTSTKPQRRTLAKGSSSKKKARK